MKQETTKCRDCASYHIIPLFEGQLNACCIDSIRAKLSGNIEKEYIKVTFLSWNNIVETMTAELYPIKNMLGHCPNFRPKNDK